MPALNYDYFLSGNPNDVLLQCISITINGSEQGEYLFVANKSDGFTTKKVYDSYDESGEPIQYTHEEFYEYAPLEISLGEVSESLSQTITVAISDVGDFAGVIEDMRDYQDSDPQFLKEKPTVVYSEWLASDNETPTLEIRNLEVSEFVIKNNMASFVCSLRKIDNRQTGVSYNTRDFPTLRGF